MTGPDDDADDADAPPKRLLTRRRFLAGLAGLGGAGAAAGAWMRWVEPDWFDVHTESVPLGLAGPVRLLHLSDFHASPAVPFELIEKAIALGVAADPDVICLTGDYITYDLPDEPRYRQLLARLADAAPTYACLGNHDGGSWPGSKHDDSRAVQALLSAAGVQLLHNTAVDREIAGQPLTLAGVGDWWNDETRPERCLPIRGTAAERPRILLNHNPDAKLLLRDFAWELMLCGHTHGGQLVVPLLGNTPFAPVVDHDYISGIYAFDGRTIHITRGVGNLHGLRFNCRPQVSLLQLT